MAKLDWMSTYLKALGAPNSQRNRNFLASWQKWEGGHTNNAAKWNFLNTTQSMPGASSINSVGVKRYSSLPQGAQAWAKTLNNGRYSGLLQGLRAGDPYSKKAVAGLSTWLSGSPTAGLDYAHKVLGTHVQAGPAGPAATVRASTPGRPGKPATTLELLGGGFDRKKWGIKTMNAIVAGEDPVSLFGQFASQIAKARNAPQRSRLVGGTRGAPAATAAAAGAAAAGGAAGGKGIDELFYDPLGGIKYGKQIGAIGGHNDHVHAAMANLQAQKAVENYARRLGLHVGEFSDSTVHPVHVNNSFHYRKFPGTHLRRAADISGSPKAMAALYRWTRANYG